MQSLMTWLSNMNDATKFMITLGSNVVVICGFLCGIYGKIRILIKSQMMDMKVDLSNKFFVYDKMDEVEDYLVMGFREKCEKYFKLGGDTWIHPMYDKSFKWNIKQTGYLK